MASISSPQVIMDTNVFNRKIVYYDPLNGPYGSLVLTPQNGEYCLLQDDIQINISTVIENLIPLYEEIPQLDSSLSNLTNHKYSSKFFGNIAFDLSISSVFESHRLRSIDLNLIKSLAFNIISYDPGNTHSQLGDIGFVFGYHDKRLHAVRILTDRNMFYPIEIDSLSLDELHKWYMYVGYPLKLFTP